MTDDYISLWASTPEYLDVESRKQPDGLLPKPNRRNVLITSALPYVNNVPHLGNIIGSVLSADVFARFTRIRNCQTLYICGTDEYGTATEMKALKEGKTPKEICDMYHHLHREIYEWFDIAFDRFGRTSTEHHTALTQEIFSQLDKNGFTSIASLEQLHCDKCNSFLADRYVEGTCPLCGFDDARGDQCDKCGKLLDAVQLINPKCHVCSSTPVIRTSNHIFLDLAQLSPEVEAYIESVATVPGSHWSTNAVSIARSWIKTGLEKRCITRDLSWGVPVLLPGFEKKVFYVWFDAPIGYLSITKSLLGDGWTKWWKKDPSVNVDLYQFLGKDNVAFHAVMFPSTMLGTREPYTMVKHLCATEYLNYEDKKFSKSRGTGVFGDTVSKIGIPADVWRFYLIYMRPETQDTAFSWDDFALKVNTELLSNLGNFIHRSLTFLYNNFDATVPEAILTETEHELLAGIDEDITQFIALFEDVKLRESLTKVLAVSRRGNQYMQANKPWVLIKGNEEERRRAGTVISITANISLLLAAMLHPFMPKVSEQIRQQCNVNGIFLLPEHPVQFIKAGHKIQQPVALFTKLEPPQVAEWKRQFGATSSSSDTPAEEKKQPQAKKNPGKFKMAGGKQQPAAAATTKKLAEELAQKYAEVLKKAAVSPDEALKYVSSIQTDMAKLRESVQGLAGAYEKTQVAALARKKQDLQSQVAKLVKELREAEIKAGVPQIPIPDDVLLGKASLKPSDAPPEPAAASAAPAAPAKKDHPKTEKKVKEKKEKAPAKPAPVDDAVDIGRLDLRVGFILEAKKHPDADALYVETIDVGEENPRTVISGLVKWVPLEQMQQRKVVCLCNLKPVKMRGIESQAMVMCASSADKVEIMEVDPSAQPGDAVTCEPFVHRPDAILNPKKKVWETVAPDLVVAPDGSATYKGSVLLVGGKTPMTAPSLRNVNVR